ncbi:hypothetical protein NDU88_001138 [Pleurodeles waltl]|uniref:BTB domain-containing protein n=1 Tax=Pleurodeles waltl TaxID=8319 RepID=A0AAV7NEA9_PLEWA|nr:hypothetical protein NDU88_001138 [Pleurodeles waltl]
MASAGGIDATSFATSGEEAAKGGGGGTAEPPGPYHRQPMYKWQATKSSLQEHFTFLFNECFVVGKDHTAQHIPAHMFMRAAGSAVFDALFIGCMATTSTEIELNDVEPAAFLAPLR